MPGACDEQHRCLLYNGPLRLNEKQGRVSESSWLFEKDGFAFCRRLVHVLFTSAYEDHLPNVNLLPRYFFSFFNIIFPSPDGHSCFSVH
jgi:hypothetical protein